MRYHYTTPPTQTTTPTTTTTRKTTITRYNIKGEEKGRAASWQGKGRGAKVTAVVSACSVAAMTSLPLRRHHVHRRNEQRTKWAKTESPRVFATFTLAEITKHKLFLILTGRVRQTSAHDHNMATDVAAVIDFLLAVHRMTPHSELTADPHR